jgi:hypothetical protein
VPGRILGAVFRRTHFAVALGFSAIVTTLVPGIGVAASTPDRRRVRRGHDYDEGRAGDVDDDGDGRAGAVRPAHPCRRPARVIVVVDSDGEVFGVGRTDAGPYSCDNGVDVPPSSYAYGIAGDRFTLIGPSSTFTAARGGRLRVLGRAVGRANRSGLSEMSGGSYVCRSR